MLVKCCAKNRYRILTARRCVQDWLDIDFAVQNNVDFIAVSFVKSADVMNNLKSYVRSRSASTIEIVAKIESFDSVPNLQVCRHIGAINAPSPPHMTSPVPAQQVANIIQH